MRGPMMRMYKPVVLSALTLAAVPAAAVAHNRSDVNVGCDATTVHYTHFQARDFPVTTTILEGNRVLGTKVTPRTAVDDDFRVTVPYAFLPNGMHDVIVRSSWPTGYAQETDTVGCQSRVVQVPGPTVYVPVTRTVQVPVQVKVPVIRTIVKTKTRTRVVRKCVIPKHKQPRHKHPRRPRSPRPRVPHFAGLRVG